MNKLTVSVTKILGVCSGEPPMEKGDYFTVENGDIRIPEGRFVCVWALQNILPLIPAKERKVCESRKADWMWRVHHVQCPDPDGRVIFKIEKGLPKGALKKGKELKSPGGRIKPERASPTADPKVNSEGEPLRVPPSDAWPISSASLPPLLGRGMKPRPATEGSYPLGSPNERLPAASHGAYSPLVNKVQAGSAESLILRAPSYAPQSFTARRLRIAVDEVKGKCTSGLKPGDTVFLNGSRLMIPPGRHFCLYALQTVLPFVAAKQRRLEKGDWLERDHRFICPDPAGNVILRIEVLD
jgi:uncharacterized repeat protein (TIGR04076 family)